MYGPGKRKESANTRGVLADPKTRPIKQQWFNSSNIFGQSKTSGFSWVYPAFLWYPLNPMVVVSGIVMIIMKKYNSIVTVKITITIITLHPLTLRLRTTHTYTHKTHIHFNSLQSHHTPSKANLKSIWSNKKSPGMHNARYMDWINNNKKAR